MACKAHRKFRPSKVDNADACPAASSNARQCYFVFDRLQQDSVGASEKMIEGFISYAREDADLCRALQEQLIALEHEEIAKFWADQRIAVGAQWEATILDRLQSAAIAVFLISPAMLWSDFIMKHEWPLAYSRHQKGELTIIPVLARPCLFKAMKKSGLASLQAVPRDGLSLIEHKPIDLGLYNAATEIAHRITSSPLGAR